MSSFCLLIHRLYVPAGLLVLGLAAASLNAQSGTFGDFEYTISNGEIAITGYTCGEANVVIPSEIEGMPVTSIGSSVFRLCDSMESVGIPGSVRNIGTFAFWNCGNLTTVTFNEGLEAIGFNAFDECDNLRDVILPSSLLEIGRSAFEECYSLTTLTIPANVTLVEGGIVGRCTALTELFVDPANVAYVSVDNVIFTKDMTELVQIFPPYAEHYSIPDSVTTLSPGAFYFSRLPSVSIPNSVTVIPANAFTGSSALESVEFPDNLTRIEAGAFSGCFQLEFNALPDSISFIGNQAFGYNFALTHVTLPENLESVDLYAFSDCTSLESVTFRQNLAFIDGDTFRNSTHLASVTFEGDAPTINGENPVFAEPYPTVYYYTDRMGWESTFSGAPTQARQGTGPWRGSVLYEGGWMQSDWYGWMQRNSAGWIFHLEHGWQTVYGESNNHVFVYDLGFGDWFYTSASLYPFIYKYGVSAGWYWYSVGGIPGERWFLHWTTQTWLQEANISSG